MAKLVTPITGGVIEVCDAKAAKFILRGFRAVPDAPKKQQATTTKRNTRKKER